MAFADLREFLSCLEKEGQLHRVKKEVNWNIEIGLVMRRVFDLRGPAVLFEMVKSSPYSLVSGAMGTYGLIGLGLRREGNPRTLINEVKEATINPVAPVLVTTGPCKENIETGSSIDLYKFPTPRWHHLDGGRFIGTLGAVITRDPQTGVRNVGIYREQLVGKSAIALLATQQTGLNLQKYRDQGRPMPVATAIGLDPATLLAACIPAPYGQDEFSIAGALRGESLEMVKCETIDLEVPANAEIILEGEICPDETSWVEEGPFGEFTGYMGLKGRQPRIDIKAVTHRNDPILQGTLEGGPPCESNTLGTIAHTAGAWSRLSRLNLPGFKELYLTDMGCRNFMAVASVDRQYYLGNARQIIQALWAATIIAKWAIVVEDDIDIFDRGQVEWALSTRVQPHRDIFITDDRQPGIDLDPSIHPSVLTYPITQSSRIGIDATTQFKGHDFPPLARPAPEQMKQIEACWSEYGF